MLLNADAIAMEEVSLTEDAIKITSDLIVPNKVKALWGKPQPTRRRTQHSTLDAKQGGVGVIYSQTHAAAQAGGKVWRSMLMLEASSYMSLRFLVSLVLTKEGKPWSKMKIHSRMPLPRPHRSEMYRSLNLVTFNFQG